MRKDDAPFCDEIQISACCLKNNFLHDLHKELFRVFFFILISVYSSYEIVIL